MSKTNDSIVLRIQDSGQGMSDEVKSRLFEPFHTTKPKGTGLGLFIVKEVLQRHEADISVKDNVPHGAIFEITFN